MGTPTADNSLMVCEAESYAGSCIGTMIHMNTYNTEDAIPQKRRSLINEIFPEELEEKVNVEFINFTLLENDYLVFTSYSIPRASGPNAYWYWM